MAQGKEADRRKQQLDDLLALVGPRKETETMADFYARYERLNDGLEAKFRHDPPVVLVPIEGNQSMRCVTCGRMGPSATTIYESARLAQRAGFWRDNKNEVWYCPEHHTHQHGSGQ